MASITTIGPKTARKYRARWARPRTETAALARSHARRCRTMADDDRRLEADGRLRRSAQLAQVTVAEFGAEWIEPRRRTRVRIAAPSAHS